MPAKKTIDPPSKAATKAAAKKAAGKAAGKATFLKNKDARKRHQAFKYKPTSCSARDRTAKDRKNTRRPNVPRAVTGKSVADCMKRSW